MNMYLVINDKVILGIDAYFTKGKLGSQVRIYLFGIMLWTAWGDHDIKGNYWKIHWGFPSINTII